MSPTVQPWQIWLINFDPEAGREQAGTRPGIVVGTALACQLPNDLVFVVPTTTTNRGLSIHPPVSGLPKPGFAMCDQLKSISRQRLVRRQPGSLPQQEIDTIKFVLRRLIDV